MAMTYECLTQDSLIIENDAEVSVVYSKRVQEAARALAEALDYDGLHVEAAYVWEFVSEENF